MRFRRADILGELAIFGGTPSFSEPRHVGRPNLGDRERLLTRVEGVLDRDWLTNDGPLVDEFEQRVAELSGAEHCVAVSNATVGMQLVARALGFSGEILMPSFTFVATAHAMRWVGLDPVFCEIDPSTHAVDPDAVARAITPRTGGIVGVHLWGRTHGAPRLAELAAERGIPLMFDAAHALGCTCALGDAEVLSFHATKVANAAEGGAVLTHDAALAERLRRMRNFGFVEYDEVGVLGTNAKMSELSAAMGLTSLESFERFVAVNRRNHAAYVAGLDGVDGVRLLGYPEDGRANYHYIVIEVAPELRDDLIAVLQAENVRARRYFHPGCHRHAPYRDDDWTLPVTEAVSARVVTLPTGTAMHEADIERVCALIRLVVEHAPELRRRLGVGAAR
jgi:dTDP-4-amino-4,6-dideoxygalactose transaminase